MLIQLFGNGSPALASVVHTVISSGLSYCVKPGLMFAVAAESGGKLPVSERHGGTALLLHTDVWSQAAADGVVFVYNA